MERQEVLFLEEVSHETHPKDQKRKDHTFAPNAIFGDLGSSIFGGSLAQNMFLRGSLRTKCSVCPRQQNAMGCWVFSQFKVPALAGFCAGYSTRGCSSRSRSSFRSRYVLVQEGSSHLLSAAPVLPGLDNVHRRFGVHVQIFHPHDRFEAIL